MAYPTGLDTFPTLADGAPAFAAYFNNIHTALVAIETELGTDPSGTYTTVAAAVTALVAATAVKPIHSYLLMGA